MGTRARSARPLIVCAFALTVAALACGRGDDQAQAEHSTITVLYCCDETTLAPFWNMSSKFLAFLPLVTEDENGELEGRLARRWEHSADYREWTFHLRTDIRWHDGVPVTARDVKFTLDFLRHPEVLLQPPDAYSIDVLDDSIFTVTYREGALQIGNEPPDFWIVYYPKHLLEEPDPAKYMSWEFWTHPVGNGPYRFLRDLPQTMVELEANSEYYAGRPEIERVVLKLGRPYGEETSMTELLSGEVDAVPYVNQMALLKVAADPRFDVYYLLDAKLMNLVAWNHRRPFFEDPRVRLALTLAIDRREIREALNLPRDVPLFDVPFTEDQLRRGKLPAPFPYDPERAEQLLDEAGWRDTDGDGVREREGTPFAFTMLASEWQQTAAAALLVQAHLRRVGIRMEVERVDLQNERQRVLAGSFDAALVLGAGPLEPAVLLGAGSPLGYANARVHRLFQAIGVTMSPEELDRLYRELASIVLDDHPVTFLYPTVWSTVARRRVRGLSSPWRADPISYAGELWLEDGE